MANRTVYFVVTDKLGNPKDKKGNPYGWYLGNEEELCKRYCEAHGLGYQKMIRTEVRV